MKKKLKHATVALFILTLVFFVAWAAVFAFNGLSINKVYTGGELFDFKGLFDNWLYPHAMNVVDLFTGKHGWWIGADGNWNFVMTYVGILFAAISVVLLVLGAVFCFKYRRKRCLFFGLVILLATVGVIEYTANYTDVTTFRPGTEFTQGYLGYLTFSLNPPQVTLEDIIFSMGTLAAAGFTYIFMIATTIVGCVYAKVLARPEEAPVEEAPVEEEAVPAEEEVAPAEEEVVGGEDVEEAFGVLADEAPAEEAVEEAPVEEATLADREDFAEEPPVEEAVEEVVVEEVPQNNTDNLVTKDDLASILKDVVRDIVRDEIARSSLAREEERNRGDHSVTGATFGGPLIVQYFNGGFPAQEPAPRVVQAPQQPQQPVEQKKEEPKPVQQAPVQQPVAAEEEEDEKKQIIRIPFTERMLSAEKDMQNDYNELKNEILSYGVNSRVSNSGDTFRLHRKTYVKITIAGKSLKLYFALDPADYAESKMPIGDASHHAVYAEIPLIFKVKSGLSMRRAKELIRDVMSKDGLEQGEVGSVNWVKELRAASK